MGFEMKKYNEEQITNVLNRMEVEQKARDLARKLGVREGTLRGWKSKFGGLEVSDARRPREEGLKSVEAAD
jgi:putative transposase